MNLKRILHFGYFPKELPPPFETKLFAEKARYIKAKWDAHLAFAKTARTGESSSQAKSRFKNDYSKYESSQLITFSLAKGIYSRRKLGIPNPKQYLDLCSVMIENWDLLRSTYKLSEYSQSTPIEKDASRSVRTKSKSWNNFKFEVIEKSFNKKIELRLDISQFYPSIYTHSIPWSLLGKDKAKKYFKLKNLNSWTTLLLTDVDAQKYKVADYIDTLVRNCNERQSIGLPIGPDTSFILAEIVGNRIDYEIKRKLSGIIHSGIRYYDDYYFYLNSIDEAEKTLKIVQQVLYEFQLETNESKVSINNIPFDYTERWSLELSNFKFKNIDKYEIRNYFSTIYKLIEENKKHSSWIVHYAFGIFEYGNIIIKKENWDFFLSLLLQVLLTDPSSINQFFKIILSYEVYIDLKSKEKIGDVLKTLINEHLSLNHSFEVSWALWIFKSLKIKCPSEIIYKVLKSNDAISKTICLDIINSKLIFGKKINVSTSSITSSQLYDENWLYLYEGNIKKWLDFKGRNILHDNEFMKIMFDYKVSFYNPKNQIETDFKIKPLNKKKTIFDIEDLLDIITIETKSKKQKNQSKSDY